MKYPIIKSQGVNSNFTPISLGFGRIKQGLMISVKMYFCRDAKENLNFENSKTESE